VIVVTGSEENFRHLLTTVAEQFLMGAIEQASAMAEFRLRVVQWT
jgi:hypothetical protein